MSKIVYLAGPKSQTGDPYSWHKRATELLSKFECVNPFKLNDYSEQEVSEHAEEVFSQDIEYVEMSDVILCRRVSNYNICGMSIEAYHAHLNGTDIVCWNDADTPLPLMLQPLVESTHETLESAANEIN